MLRVDKRADSCTVFDTAYTKCIASLHAEMDMGWVHKLMGWVW